MKNVLKMGCNVFFGNSYLAVVYGRLPHERTFYWKFIVLFLFFLWAKFFWYEELRFCWMIAVKLLMIAVKVFKIWMKLHFYFMTIEKVVFVFLGIIWKKKKKRNKILSQYPVCSFTVYKLSLKTKMYRLLHYAKPSTCYNFRCCSLSGFPPLKTYEKINF